MKKNLIKIISIIFGVIVVMTTIVFAETPKNINNNFALDVVVCPMDARKCPDGSFVGRIAPDCNFAECPVDLKKDEEYTENLVINENEIKNTEIVCSAEYKPVCVLQEDEYTKNKIKNTLFNICAEDKNKIKILYEGHCDENIKIGSAELYLFKIFQKYNILIDIRVIDEIIEKLKQAKTEEERMEIFETEIISNLNLIKNIERMNIISDRSNIIFFELDNFIKRAQILNYHLNRSTFQLKKAGFDNLYLLEKNKIILNNIEITKNHKIMAWLYFNMIPLIKNEEKIKDNILNTEKELELTKNKLRETFDIIKKNRFIIIQKINKFNL